MSSASPSFSVATRYSGSCLCSPPVSDEEAYHWPPAVGESIFAVRIHDAPQQGCLLARHRTAPMIMHPSIHLLVEKMLWYATGTTRLEPRKKRPIDGRTKAERFGTAHVYDRYMYMYRRKAWSGKTPKLSDGSSYSIWDQPCFVVDRRSKRLEARLERRCSVLCRRPSRWCHDGAVERHEDDCAACARRGGRPF